MGTLVRALVRALVRGSCSYNSYPTVSTTIGRIGDRLETDWKEGQDLNALSICKKCLRGFGVLGSTFKNACVACSIKYFVFATSAKAKSRAFNRHRVSNIYTVYINHNHIWPIIPDFANMIILARDLARDYSNACLTGCHYRPDTTFEEAVHCMCAPLLACMF